ncbi:uncharacterized protein LOC121381182 isoform X1 [Gigantopelta aegis]|uniref:uncharacterized protein LOC121381182 isoform X1 n=1 Tax=Gigantopelta aegis TaxID=1735272 RepID=UPI001B88A736|nr:uncharacterized protein LOC121381182 isoform X1 [Gigantopelta aegis]
MKGFVNIPVHNLLCCQINRGFKSLKVHSSDINPSNYNTMMMMPAVLFVAFLLASPNHGQYPGNTSSTQTSSTYTYTYTTATVVFPDVATVSDVGLVYGRVLLASPKHAIVSSGYQRKYKCLLYNLVVPIPTGTSLPVNRDSGRTA